MSAPPGNPVWTVLADAVAVAETAAERVLAAAARAVARDGTYRLVLAGGGTPLAAYRLLAAAEADWAHWRIFFGDERCLPPSDPQRNSRAARDAWLERVAIPAEQIADIPAEQGPVAAAALYAERLRLARPFHMVLLGLGEDGHTASLFPSHAESAGAVVLPVFQAPKPPSERVSLSSAALSDAEDVLILATGAGKREAVARWRAGEELPVGRIRARGRLEVLLDPAAAGE